MSNAVLGVGDVGMSAMTPGTDPDDALQRLADLRRSAAPLEPDPGARRELTALVTAHVDRFLDGVDGAPAVAPGDGAGEKLARYGVPDLPRDPADVLGVLGRLVESPGVATTSPRYLGYIPSGGLYHAALADFLAAASNRYAGLASVSPGAAGLEAVVVRMLADVVGLGPAAGGTLTSGGTVANLTAVVTARDHAGALAPGAAPVVYLGEETHHAVDLALRVAGLATAVVRRIPSDDRRRMDAAALAEAVRADRSAGLRPFLVVATAGTTGAGAVDPLDRIADVAQAHGLWFHVDGAYGGLFTLTAAGRAILGGLERADSVVVDPHKTLFLPYGTGAVLVRDEQLMRRTFAQQAEYLVRGDDPSPSPADLGPELTRHFRALRVWLPLQLAGRRAFEAALEEKLLLARHAHRRLAADPRLEVGPEPDLAIVTFRLAEPAGADTATAELADALRRRGQVFLTTTRLGGRLTLRIAIGSFRTHLEDVDACVEEVLGALDETVGPAATVVDLRPRLEFSAGTPDREILDCELDVLASWYGDTPEDLEEAYGAYADSTLWLAVREPSGPVLGVSRLIAPGPLPQKTLSDLGEEPWAIDGYAAALAAGVDPDAAWDLATVGVRPELGGRGEAIAAALYHGIIAATTVNEVRSVVAMLDARVLRLLRRLGLGLRPLPGARPRPYMGSPAIVPVYAHVDEALRAQQRTDPDQYRRITLGQGLTEVVLPPRETFRLPPVVVDLRSSEPRPA